MKSGCESYEKRGNGNVLHGRKYVNVMKSGKNVKVMKRGENVKNTKQEICEIYENRKHLKEYCGMVLDSGPQKRVSQNLFSYLRQEICKSYEKHYAKTMEIIKSHRNVVTQMLLKETVFTRTIQLKGCSCCKEVGDNKF